MLRSTITSTVSLLVIALANPLLNANAQRAGGEFFLCEAKGFTWITDATGNEPPGEEVEIRLMVEVDEPNGNVKFSEPIKGDDWSPWRPAIFDRDEFGRWEGLELSEQIMHTKTEFTIFRHEGVKFDFMRTQSTVFPKFLTIAEGDCSRY
ncbi:putative conserved secreted protein [Synechococcus sp. NOUM97013]|nr:putative conserved secreted protein [Synechococcus sp. NOUM97013]